jgi:hypothetical protein
VVVVIETGLGGLVLGAAAAVRQYDLQGPRHQIVAADTLVVGLPGGYEPASQVSFVHPSRPDLRAAEDQMIAGNIETVPGQYRGAQLVEDDHSAAQGVPGHNQFGVVLGID